MSVDTTLRPAQALPAAIGLCTALVELTLGFNALATLPDELGLCEHLATLDVRNNAITALGEGVPALRLTLLDLTNNDMRALPPALGLMTSLRAMPLTANPLTSIPRGIREGVPFLFLILFSFFLVTFLALCRSRATRSLPYLAASVKVCRL